MRHAPWILALALASAPVLGQEKMVDPGLYEITTKSVAGTETVKKCLTAKDVASGMKPALPPGCTSTKSVIAGGKLDFASTCPDMSMKMTGSYTSTSYVIDGKVIMKGDDEPSIESHITAKRLAASC